MKDYELHGAAHRSFDEPGHSDLEDELIDAMERNDEALSEYRASRDDLMKLYTRVVSAWVFDGARISKMVDRNTPLPLLNFKEHAGNSRGAVDFTVVSAPTIELSESGAPEQARWYASAIPMSPKTGKAMSGRPGNGRVSADTVRLYGYVFHDFGATTKQQARDAFIKMVAEADIAIHSRGTGHA